MRTLPWTWMILVSFVTAVVVEIVPQNSKFTVLLAGLAVGMAGCVWHEFKKDEP